MRKSAEILFKLLRLSLGREEEFPLLDEASWQEVYDLAKEHALLGVIFRGIEALPDEKWPPKKLSMREYSQVKFIRGRNESLDKLSRIVCDRLRSDGLDCVLIKGQGLAALYDDPTLRVGGDIDVWSSAPRERLISYARASKPACKVFYHHVDLKPAGKFEVELHFTPTWMNSPFANRRLQAFFEEQKPRLFNNSAEGLPVPDCEFNRVFILVHIYRHLFSEGVGLRQLMDYYHVLRTGFSSGQKAASVKVIESLGLGRFAAAVMYVLGYVFGLEKECMLVDPDSRRGEKLLEEVLRAGNFGHGDDSFSHDGFGKVARSLRFIGQYPSEVLWAPVFKLWQILFIRLKYNVLRYEKK